MSYTPVELRHVRIARSLLGYNRSAVEELLTQVADSFETVWRERHELADRIEVMERELGELREREHVLTETLVVAERAATNLKDQAKRDAELIVAEAHNEARSVARDAQAERARLQADTRRIEALLRAALGMFDEADGGDEPALDPSPLEADPQEQPQLRKVSGGFDWME